MSETTKNNVTSIKQAPSANSFERRVDSALAVAETTAPTMLPMVERPRSRTESGLRYTRRGKFVLGLAGVATLVAAKFGVDALQDKVGEAMQDRQAQNVQVMEDYKSTGDVPEGSVVIESDQHGTAWDYSSDVAAEDGFDDLVDIVSDQANAQGVPGVEQGEVYVVPADAVNPEVAQIIDRPKQ